MSKKCLAICCEAISPNMLNYVKDGLQALPKSHKACIKTSKCKKYCSIQLDGGFCTSGTFDYLIICYDRQNTQCIALEIHPADTSEVTTIKQKFHRTEKCRKKHNCQNWDYYWVPPRRKGISIKKDSRKWKELAQLGIQIRRQVEI
ncbi:MAG: hypothetical protein GXO48_08695 [Chlorobi bacterium]|nr:hypothetical protein [Chlorobiota bacterium]